MYDIILPPIATKVNIKNGRAKLCRLLLSFFSEIVISEACGRLIFPLISYAGYYKHDDRDCIRKHLEKRCSAHFELKGTDGGQVGACDVETSEHY